MRVVTVTHEQKTNLDPIIWFLDIQINLCFCSRSSSFIFTLFPPSDQIEEAEPAQGQSPAAGGAGEQWWCHRGRYSWLWENWQVRTKVKLGKQNTHACIHAFFFHTDFSSIFVSLCTNRRSFRNWSAFCRTFLLSLGASLTSHVSVCHVISCTCWKLHFSTTSSGIDFSATEPAAPPTAHRISQ